MDDDIFINKNVWSKFSSEELHEYIERVFMHYRINGFPFYSTDPIHRQKEFDKLLKYNGTVLDLETKTIKQTMHGLNLAWSYMRHSFSVPCNSMKTPMDIFNDDELFRKAIYKRIKFGDNISDSGIRKILKIFSGTQCVSNFRPTASGAIYRHFCNKGDTTWDMSSGYGGRLLGSVLGGVKYIGTEPCTETYNGLNELISDFNIDAKIMHHGSEIKFLDDNSIDFVFTSPPYFNTEQYSTEESQSYIKYPTKDEWLNGFLYNSCLNAYNALKPNKYFVINIANVKSYPDLEFDTNKLLQKIGFTYIDTYKLLLSNLNSKGYKYEPIFIYKK